MAELIRRLKTEDVGREAKEGAEEKKKGVEAKGVKRTWIAGGRGF